MSALRKPPVRLASRPRPTHPLHRRAAALAWACILLAGCGSPPSDEPIILPPLQIPADDPSPTPLPESPAAVDVPADSPRAPTPPLSTRLTLEPGEGVLSGDVWFTAIARDPVAIRSLRFVAPLALTRGRAVHVRDGGGHRAEMHTALDTRTLADGPVAVTVRAETVDGRVTEHTVQYIVSSHGPRITWRGVPVDRRVSGRWTFEAVAADREGVKSLTPADPTLVDLDPAPDRLRVEVDTRRWPEGPRVITLEARDATGERSRSTQAVIVDNAAPPVIDGSVWFGGPVAGCTVQAVRIEGDGSDGDRIDACPDAGCATDARGRFALPLADDHRGPVRFRATAGADARAYEPMSDGLRAVPAGSQLWAAVGSLGNRPVRIHGITSLADATARAWMDRGRPINEAIRSANGAWGEHTCEGCAVSEVEPVGAGGHTTLTAAVRLGLFHGGLSQMALDLAAREAREPVPARRSAWRLLWLARFDLGDGVLDGRPTAGVDAVLDPFSLRAGVAEGVQRLLGRRPGWLDVPQTLLRGEAGWLDAIAARTSVLWPEAPAPRPLDTTPPAVTIVSPEVGTVHGRRAISLVATGKDDGVPPRLYIVAPEGIEVRPVLDEPGRIEAQLYAWERGEGPATIRVLAEDDAGRLSEATVEIEIDHTRPTVTLTELDGTPLDDETRYVRTPTYAFLAHVDDPDAEVSTQLPSTVRTAFGAQIVIVEGYDDGRNRVEVIATDPAGNRGTARFVINGVGDRPTLSVTPSAYTPARQHGVALADCADQDADSPLCGVRMLQQLPHQRTPLSGDALLPSADREPITLEVLPVPSGMYDAPSVVVEVGDETGRRQIEMRTARDDGPWSPWRRHSWGMPRFTLDLSVSPSGGPITESAVERVEFRLTDHAGQQTTRGFVWRREVVAPPLAITRSPRFAEGPGWPAVTALGFGFGPDEQPIEGLLAPGTPRTADGFALERWRVHNPWPVPVTVSFSGLVTAEHLRSNAYRIAATEAGVPPCPVGQWFRGPFEPAGGRANCSAFADALNGERVVARLALAFRTAFETEDGELAPVPAEGLELMPGRHASVYLVPPLAPFELFFGHEQERESRFAQYEVRAPDRVVRYRTIERDSGLRWSVEGVQATSALAGEPDDADWVWTRLPDVTVERSNARLDRAMGIEYR